MSTDLRQAAVELDGTPGAMVPAERLDETDVWNSHLKRQRRLEMAWDLFCAKQAGQMTTHGNVRDLRAWCWDQADAFLGESATPPAAPAPQPRPGEVGRSFILLKWLAEHGPMPAGEVPIGFRDDADVGDARWVLRREKLAGFNEKGELELTDRGREVYGVTAMPKESVPAGGVSLADQEAAA